MWPLKLHMNYDMHHAGNLTLEPQILFLVPTSSRKKLKDMFHVKQTSPTNMILKPIITQKSGELLREREVVSKVTQPTLYPKIDY